MNPSRRARPSRLLPLLALLLVAIILQALGLASRHGALHGLHLHLALEQPPDPASIPAQAGAGELPLPSLSWPPGPDRPALAREIGDDQTQTHAQAHAQGLADHRHALQQRDWLGLGSDSGEDGRSTSPVWHPPQAGPGPLAAAPGVALRRGPSPAEAWADWRQAPPQRPPRAPA